MENAASIDDIVVFRVKNICCKVYQKKLKKELSRINGVYAIAINPEKSLVSVRGRVDANVVLNTITKTGKNAQIIAYPNNTNESRHHQNANERERKYHFQRGNHSPEKNRDYKIDESEERHMCEDYIPPMMDERFRRNVFSRNQDMRPIFSESVPLGSYPYQSYNRPPSYGFGSFGVRPFGRPPPPPMYGYSRRPMHGYNDHGYYGYGSGRGVSFM